jgi:hypothetical protein
VVRLLDCFKRIVEPKFKLLKRKFQILTSETFLLRGHLRNTRKQRNSSKISLKSIEELSILLYMLVIRIHFWEILKELKYLISLLALLLEKAEKI